MPVCYVKLQGHVTQESFHAALGEAALAPEPRYLLIDTLAMTGFDPEVRAWFVDEWTRDHPIRCLAGISDKLLWRTVGSAVGLAAGVRTLIASTVEEGQRFCRECEAADRSADDSDVKA